MIMTRSRYESKRPLVPALLLFLAGTACSSSPAPAGAAGPTPSPTQSAARESRPERTYWVYVGAESADLIHRIRFGPDGAVLERSIMVGESPSEMEGPHGLQISRDGRFLHMTTGHGSPDGKYWRYVLGPDTLTGPGALMGKFPASVDVTPDGMYAFLVNFNLHGSMVPSSVSVVDAEARTEVARITTCVMPHGSRMSPDGTRQYSTCMMDDQLVEVDAVGFKVARRFNLRRGTEGALPENWEPTSHVGHQMPAATCSPTWAQPSVDGSRIYVACNRADTIVEIDRDRWVVTRRFATGRGPYNLAVTPDGKYLVASLKQGSSVQLFDLVTGQSVMQMRSSTTLTHGVTVSPDSRYAFISSEGVGAAPGKVDIYDLPARTRVATVDVGQQAGGITFWKME
ncbi:MAG: YncE family protein [Actinomycetota bacterium]|nr:YncE family protein [Actinomycetota bacterium]